MTLIPAAEHVYLVIGAKQVQTWISMTPRLRLRRGASRMLEDGTLPETTEAWLAAQRLPAEVATDAGAVAGVVALEVHDAGLLEAIADRLLAQLSDVVPGVAWAGWARTGVNYPAAYRAHQEAELTGIDRSHVFSSTPVSGELTFVGSCPGCRAEPAQRTGPPDHRDDETTDYRYGVACARRYLVDQENRKRTGRYFRDDDGVEDRQVTVWGQGKLALRLNAAHDLTELARRGATAHGQETTALLRKESRSHLAVIDADGNSIGSFIEELLKLGRPADEYGRIVRALTKGIIRATTDAARRVMPAEEAISATEPNAAGVPVLRGIELHYAGGDDLLASVVARHAWRFVHQFVADFERIRTDLREIVDEDPEACAIIGNLSIGVGVAFAHLSHPFEEARRAAERALGHAKRRGGGTRSVIGFCDLTVDGLDPVVHLVDDATLATDLADPESDSGPPFDAPVWDATARRELLGLTPTAIHQIANLLTPRRDADALAILDRLGAHLRRIADDEGRSLTLVTPNARTFGTTRDDQQRAAKAALDELRSLVVRARWWPTDDAADSDPAALETTGARP